MNDNNPEPIPSPNPPPEPSPVPGSTPPQEPQDWREQRREERRESRDTRRERRSGRHSGWFWGVLLFVVGLILLLQQMNIAIFTNWWALFILIPAFWCFAAAGEASQAAHRFNRRAAFNMVGGILLTLVALAFLFNFYPLASYFWPALLLLGGLALLVSAVIPE